MSEVEPVVIHVDGAPIAVRHRPGSAPGIMWLGGYRSDMMGTKAQVLDSWGIENGVAVTRHDYSGHGESGGDFENGTISRWLKESLAVFEQFTEGRQILVGSSMGAWIALRMVEELAKAEQADRLAGLLLIAPAPDFTTELVEPQLSEQQRRSIEETGRLEEPSQYSDFPTIYTKALLDDGRHNRVLEGVIDTHCPVHILQGMADPDVPYSHAMRLLEHLPKDDVTITLIRDGDHRLSRPQDLSLMIKVLTSLREASQNHPR